MSEIRKSDLVIDRHATTKLTMACGEPCLRLLKLSHADAELCKWSTNGFVP